MGKIKVQVKNSNITQQDILTDIKSVAKKIDKMTLTSRDYRKHGKFSDSTVLSKFKKWNIALSEAGLETPKKRDITIVDLIENLANVWNKKGRQPTSKEMDDIPSVSLFSAATYKRRFGCWNKALLAFEEFINGNSNEKRDKLENACPSFNSRQLYLSDVRN